MGKLFRAHSLGYVFGRRKDEVFLELKALLDPFGITRYYTDSLGTYQRHPLRAMESEARARSPR